MDYALCKKALNDHIYCGDAGLILEDEDRLFLAVVDALGHGEIAQQQADASLAYLTGNYRLPLPQMMQGLHTHLRGGRGVVASLCRLQVDSGELSYVSIGDTQVRKLNGDGHRICSRPGVIGYQIRTPIEGRMQLITGDVLLLHSDGIASHFNDWDETLLEQGASDIATELLARYGKRHDDNICLVLKYSPSV